jgi:inorganic pyrophosphatase
MLSSGYRTLRNFANKPLYGRINCNFTGFSLNVTGEKNTKSYRINYKSKDTGAAISPWHDIPLRSDDDNGNLYNFITEIPKNTKAKFEINISEKGNPISQDVSKGNLRDYHGPIFWNYGCLPQTWEDPSIKHNELNFYGDNDPLDVVEIGTQQLNTGSVTPVKVLGVLAMIDTGELDWKVIAISSYDDNFHNINNINDVNKLMPGVISGIREWFRWYKTPDNKPLNTFGYNEQCLDSDIAIKVIEETHSHYMHLRQGKSNIDNNSLWLPASQSI